MKMCPYCNAQLENSTAFCTRCGKQLNMENVPTRKMGLDEYSGYQNYDQFNHTSEFDRQDVSDNKVFAMLPYLMGIFGIIVSVLASSTSEYVRFHVRQAVKITVTKILLGFIMLVVGIINLIPIVGWILYALIAIGVYGTLFVVKVICFFQICSGRAVEPYIVRNLNFLR